MLLHCTFAQAVRLYGWHELYNFSRHLPEHSATLAHMNREETAFSRDLQQSAILADIFDMLANFAFAFSKAHGGKASPPKPYKRPWDSGNAQKFGRGAIPVSEFNNWYYGGD